MVVGHRQAVRLATLDYCRQGRQAIAPLQHKHK